MKHEPPATQPAPAGRGSPYVMVRMPDALKRWLKHQAVDNHRSLANEVLHRLEQSRSAEQQPQGAGQ